MKPRLAIRANREVHRFLEELEENPGKFVVYEAGLPGKRDAHRDGASFESGFAEPVRQEVGRVPVSLQRAGLACSERETPGDEGRAAVWARCFGICFEAGAGCKEAL